MSEIGRVAALILAAVFVVAAVSKLRSPATTARDLTEIGLRAPRLLAWLLPLGELATAVALVLAPGWGGVIGFALLAAFTVVLVRLVREGRPVACRCFGGFSSEPVSPLTLARNAVLLLLAAAASAA